MLLTPRQLFRKDKESAGQLAIAIGEPWMQKALVAALSEMAARGQTAEIPGANVFVQTLNSLAADDPEPPKEPEAALKSYGM